MVLPSASSKQPNVFCFRKPDASAHPPEASRSLTIKAVTTYDTDFLEWTQLEAEKLRERRLDELDVENLAEEIESLGKRERSTLVNRLVVLLTHQLKHDHQPERYGRSCELTMASQRIKIGRLLKQNPSLKPFLPEAVIDAYQSSRIEAARQTRLDLNCFPEGCPYTLDDLHIAVPHSPEDQAAAT